MRVCRSPELIAAYHGLHRLRVPRHSPHAYNRLTQILLLTKYARSTRARQFKSELHHYGVWIHSACALLGAHAGFPQSCCPSVVKQRSQVPVRAPGQKKKTGLSVVVVRAGDTRALSVQRADLLASSVKEVIQPQVPLRLPCYDFAPVTRLAFGGLLPCGLRHRLRALRASMA